MKRKVQEKIGEEKVCKIRSVKEVKREQFIKFKSSYLYLASVEKVKKEKLKSKQNILIDFKKEKNSARKNIFFF